MTDSNIPEYGWQTSEATCAHDYLLPGLDRALADWRTSQRIEEDQRLRLFDAGCGNGFLAHAMAERGYEVAGCDFSAQGIVHARDLLPDARFERMSVYDDMAAVFGGGGWDIVLSSEVIEHLYEPAKLVQNVLPLLRPGGLFLVSTPYHG
jgi:2-polyprenyl-6-hydroxyphenyl methylase/3-demethylubiquinone-9 3-methyltransferase